MRGAVPNGVVAPRGEISVTVSPTLTRSELASRMPMAMPSWPSKPSSVPARTLSAISGSALCLLAHAAHLAPSACAGVEAITWPSISGTAA